MVIFIVIALHAIQCFGWICYEIPKVAIDLMLQAGLLESIIEIPGAIVIYRRSKRKK